MRTTLKRGIGRGAAVNGNGRAVLPPAVLAPEPATVKRYQQPPPPRRGVGHAIARVLVWIAAVIVVTGAGAAGGLYLYAHESLSDTRRDARPTWSRRRRSSTSRFRAQPAIALIIGYDKRAGVEAAFEARSDTVMLVRTDPEAKAVSMLSFPRDLIVDVHCPGRAPFRGKINEAYTDLRREGDARDGPPADRPSDQLPDDRQLPRLQADRGQARRGLDRRRPALLQRQHDRLRALRDDRPPTRLPEAQRVAGARLRPLPPLRLRPVPDRPAAAVREGVQRGGDDGL